MKLIWYPVVSLDGYIADDRGNSDFVTAEDDRQWGELIQAAGAVVVGRRTFDQYRGAVYPIAGATTYVITRNPGPARHDPSVVYVPGGPLEVMRRLHAGGHAMAVLAGGGQAAGLFAQHNLIDEAWISVYPLILGGGTRLMGGYRGRLRLSAKESYAMPGGVIHSRYEIT